MNLPLVAAPALGAIAILANTATLTFTITFTAVLSRHNASRCVPIIVASSVGGLGLGSVFLLVSRQLRYRNRNQEGQLRGWWWRRISQTAGLFCLLSSAVTFAAYMWMHIRREDLATRILGADTATLLTIAFILWGVSAAAHALFLLTVLILDRRAAQQIRSRSLHHLEPQHNTTASEMGERLPSSRPQTSAPRTSGGKESGSTSDDSRTSTWSSRRRSGSDTMASFRSSLTHVVRPITSKTRLVNSHSKCYRPRSLDSGTGEREIVEDSLGFDSWDTSAVDPHSRQTVMNSSSSSTKSNTNASNNNSSPIPQRFLETIPASPTGSRSPSPGFPLDLEFPVQPFAHRRRSRSHSPGGANLPRRERAASPSSTLSAGEMNIHPLFRSDSPTPPPSATPGTIVTAAPNAGQVIPLNHRPSLNRMRSGSLPNSPSLLVHSSSLDDIGRVSRARSPLTELSLAPVSPTRPTSSIVTDEEDGDISEDVPEREMTPPIPEWVLGAGPRSSMTGYTRRKGLDVVGEEKGDL
jgi:hypothetical protein